MHRLFFTIVLVYKIKSVALFGLLPYTDAVAIYSEDIPFPRSSLSPERLKNEKKISKETADSCRGLSTNEVRFYIRLEIRLR